jgi:hypothetical protein
VKSIVESVAATVVVPSFGLEVDVGGRAVEVDEQVVGDGVGVARVGRVGDPERVVARRAGAAHRDAEGELDDRVGVRGEAVRRDQVDLLRLGRGREVVEVRAAQPPRVVEADTASAAGVPTRTERRVAVQVDVVGGVDVEEDVSDGRSCRRGRVGRPPAQVEVAVVDLLVSAPCWPSGPSRRGRP